MAGGVAGAGVLLSATLTGRSASSLVDAYRRGAGYTAPCNIQPAYPGWLFTDAATGEVSHARAVATLRPRTWTCRCGR